MLKRTVIENIRAYYELFYPSKAPSCNEKLIQLTSINFFGPTMQKVMQFRSIVERLSRSKIQHIDAGVEIYHSAHN